MHNGPWESKKGKEKMKHKDVNMEKLNRERNGKLVWEGELSNE
jgi:hypothetical protein